MQVLYKFLEVKKCSICNSVANERVYYFKKEYYNHNEFETASWDGRQPIDLNIVQCPNCGLVYTNPAFKSEYLHMIYPLEIIDESNDFKGYLIRNKKYLKLLKISKKYIRGMNLCDIGTRYGCFPYLAEKTLKIQSFGIEFNSRSVEIANKNRVDVIEGTIKDLPIIMQERKYHSLNNIFLDDVLEHLVNPFEDIGIISKLQKKGDRIFLRQMNLDSLGHKMYKDNWYYIQPAGHLYYFNDKTITRLLEDNGYKVLKIHKFPFLLNLFLTILKIIKRNIFTHVLKRPKIWLVNGKKMYLTNRFASYDDMFLVIAEKV